MDFVLNGAFVVATVAFLHKQFDLSGKPLLFAAFAVCALAAEWPLLLAALPTVSPWLENLGKALALFVSSVGSVDFATYLQNKGAEANVVAEVKAEEIAAEAGVG